MTSSLINAGVNRAFALVAGLLICALGCSSRPAAISPPDVDPQDLASALMSDLDKDSSGSLSAAELEAAPAVVDRLPAYDGDKNGEVSLDELNAHLARVFDGRTGLMAAACRVTRNGKPFGGAIVHFVPIRFLEGAIPVTSGVTQANGLTRLSIRPENLPPNSPQRQGLCRPGLYSVEVTHPEIKVPEQYNVKTTLGREVSPEVALAGAIEIPLKF